MPIYRGCVYEKDIKVTARSNGQPVDISAWQFASDLKDETGAVLLPMSTAGGQFLVTDGPNGQYRIMLTPTQTSALPVGPVNGAIYRTDATEGRLRLARYTDQVRDQD